MNPTFKKPINLLKRMGILTTPFGGQTRGEDFHPGVDIANKSGTNIPAITPGVVTFVGTSNNGFGNTVTVKAPNGDSQQFAHLQKALVRPGQKVAPGQTIAKMGSSGNSYSKTNGDPSHLDLRIVSAFGKYKNPYLYLQNFK